jgi:hypothetical protein
LLVFVYNGLKARKHGIDGFSIQLKEVLILSLVRLEESSFDLNGSLMIALKPHPDLSSGSTIRDSLKLRKQKTQEKNIMRSTICVMLILLLLSGTSMRFKHNISSILINLPDKPINPLNMCGHTNLPIGVVCSIEERWFAETTLHVAFVDHGLIKVE